MQPDGKIVVLGNMQTTKVIVRYNNNGTLDTSFGSNGITSIDFPSFFIKKLALQPDGKLLVAGQQKGFAVVRYNSNGTLDNTFDSDGKVTTDFGGSNETALSVAIQSDGRIVLAGYIWDTPTEDNFAIAPYIASNAVGIERNNIEDNILIASPNPFTNYLLIKGTKEKGEIIIFDMRGKEFIRQKAFNAETKILTESLLPGLYLLKYSYGSNVANFKLIKF